jgi:hypothetical protein
VLTLIYIEWLAISQTEPAAERNATFVLFGVPGGVVLIIIGQS